MQLAAASKALIIGFNVRADAGARDAIKDTGVEVRYYSIIYEVIDDVRQMMSGMLKPEIKETIVGVAQVREVFRSSKFGVVAGCLVTEGVVKRNNPIRVLRDNVVIFEGALESLRRFKDEVGRSACRYRVRYRCEELPGCAGRRPDRVLLSSRSRSDASVRWLKRRRRRIEAEIQRVLSDLIAREVKDPRVGNVTITAVNVAADMGAARVFFTPFASSNPPEEVRIGLTHAGASCAVRSAGDCGCGTRRGSNSSSTTRRRRPPS